jgi:beta-barrel assembly-enhancing protease
MKELGIGIIFTIITGGDAGLVSEAIRLMASSSFDREQEKEADDYALQLLEKAQIHPKHMASFFKRLSQMQGNLGNIELFMTHPDTDKRAENAENYTALKEIDEKSFDINWEEVKNSY